MHLEGALSASTMFALAKRNSINLPTTDSAFSSPAALSSRYENFTSLDDFLHYYYIGMSVLINASDYEDLAYDYFTHAAAANLMHAELFFDPQAHTSRGVTYTTILSGFESARERALEDYKITSELIVCFLRHLPIPDCISTFNDPALQSSLRTRKVIGIGLDSSEANFPPELFTDIYTSAKELGAHRTAHAGEEGPPSYVTTALDDLHVQRIDHGLRIAESETLMSRIAAEGIMLTLCPLSNLRLGGVKRIADLPVRTFLHKGVRFSVNSDDPAYFGGYIGENFCAVQEAFDLSVEDWVGIVRWSVEGSWCGSDRKREIMDRLEEVRREWTG